MNCCSVEGTDRCFSRFAARYEKRFRRGGLDRAQRLILEGLNQAGVQGKTMLDIGCGVGSLHLTLLQQGAGEAVGVEISEGMIQRARTLAGLLGLQDRVHYFRGDFVELAEQVSSSDIVMLDKVVCCYSEPDRLIAASASKCGALYAVSYPRDSFLGRAAMGIPAFVGKLLHWSFHPYYHPPALIVSTIVAQGFTEAFSAVTWIWQVRVFKRDV